MFFHVFLCMTFSNYLSWFEPSQWRIWQDKIAWKCAKMDIVARITFFLWLLNFCSCFFPEHQHRKTLASFCYERIRKVLKIKRAGCWNVHTFLPASCPSVPLVRKLIEHANKHNLTKLWVINSIHGRRVLHKCWSVSVCVRFYSKTKWAKILIKTANMAPSPESLHNYSSKQMSLVLTDKC